jgi:LPS export ABC transporter protein LptC
MERFFYIIVVVFFTACSLDYSDADLAEKLSEEIPNTVIYKYETVEIQNGSPILQIKAEKAEVYNSKEETYLTDVDFYNYKNDEINTRGRSDYAVLHMKSGDAEMTGSIEIRSEEDESSLEAESLSWIDKEKNLSSFQEDNVTVIDKDGSELNGHGFSADIRRKTILFENEIKGEFISDEEN